MQTNRNATRAHHLQSNAKKALHFMLALCFIGGSASLAWGGQFVRGDVNEDGVLDISDAIYALGWLYAGEKDPSCIDAVDVNDDSYVDISDPIYILNYLFQGLAAPPEPFIAPGYDLTNTDPWTCGSSPAVGVQHAQCCQPAPDI